MSLGPWALPPEVFQFLKERLIYSASVLELGSGEGTAELVKMFGRVHTVEHDPVWLNKIEGAHYIHAPIVDGWYCAQTLSQALPKTYDALVIDGPPGAIGRGGILKHLDLFLAVPTIVDDIHRHAEYELAVSIARQRKQNLSLHYLQDGRGFGSIGFRL